MIQHLAQVHDLGLAVGQCQHNGAKGLLQLGVLVQLIQHHLGVHVTAQFHHHAHTGTVGLVTQVGDAFHALVLVQVGDGLYQTSLVDHIGDLGDDDAETAVLPLLDLGLTADDDLAAAGGIGSADAAAAHDDTAGGEVGTLDKAGQILQLGLGIVDDQAAGIHQFAQIMGRNVGCHTDSDTLTAVGQQIGETGRHHVGFLQLIVKVGGEIDGLLVDVLHHLVTQLGQTGLGITVSSRGVAVDAAEVTLSVDEGIAQRKTLCHTHHGVVYAGVTVGMVTAQHVTHGGGRLAEGLVNGQTVLVHGVQDAAVDRLQAVAHIRQRTGNDNAHGIRNEGFLHLPFQIYRDDFLIFIAKIAHFIITCLYFRYNYYVILRLVLI